LRDAYTLLDQIVSFSRDGITLEKIRSKLGLVGIDQISRIVEIISQRDKKAILESCSDVLDQGVSVEQFVVDLTDYFRNLLLLKCGIRTSSLLSGSPDDYPQELVKYFHTEQIEKAIELLLELHRNLRFSLQQRFDLELVLCQLASLQDLIDPAELLETIRALKADLFSGSTGVAASRDGPTPVGLPRQTEEVAGERSAGTNLPGKREGTFEDLVEGVRREKLALSTALQKCDSWKVEDGELQLSFTAQDRFSAEQVNKERDTVIKQAGSVFTDHGVSRLRVEILGGEQESSSSVNQQAEIVKKIFRGQVLDNGE
jgi:DNA polymerase-3 subunit gamma/tau